MAIEVLELQVRTTGTQASAEQMNQLGRSVGGVRSALGLMRNALVAFSFIRAASGIVELLDAFTVMQNKLALVTRNTSEAAAVTQELVDVAARSRTSLDTTTTLFTRMARSLTTLHLTYGELLDITEATNKALAISGATADEARNAIVQFTQGLALGTLRGQDLRSVVEFAPRLAQVFAEGLGKNTEAAKTFGQAMKLSGGQLYAFVTAHKNILTSKVAIESYKDSLSKLNAEFALTVPTIANGFTLVSNAFLVFIGRANQANGVGVAIFNTLKYISENLEGLAVMLALVGAILVTKYIALPIAEWFARLAFSIALVSVQLTLFTIRALAAGVAMTALFVLNLPTTIASIGAAIGGIAGGIVGLTTTVIALIADLIAMGPLLVIPFIAALPLIGTFIASALTLGAVFGAIGVAIGGVVSAVLGLLAPLGQLGSIGEVLDRNLKGPVVETKITLADLPKVFAGVANTIIDNWNEFGPVMQALWQDMLNGMKNSWSNYWTDIRNDFRTSIFGLYNTPLPAPAQLPVNTAQPLINSLKEKLAANIKAQLTNSKPDTGAGIRGVQSKLSGTSDDISTDKDQSKKIATLQQQIENFLARVSPKFDIDSKILRITTLFKEFVKVAGQAKLDKILGPLGEAGVLDRVTREELGLGNATAYHAEREQLLTEYLAGHADALDDVTNAMRKNDIEFLQQQRTVEAGIELAKKQLEDDAAHKEKFASDAVKGALANSEALKNLATTQEALTLAKKQGILSEEQYVVALRKERDTVLELQRDSQSGITLAVDAIQDKLTNEKDIAKQIVTDALAEETALKMLAVQTKVLDDAVKSGAISNAQYDKTLRDIRISALDAQTDTSSGFERGLLKAQKDLSDTAKLSEKVITDMFSGLTDTLVTFFKTGKLSFKDLFDTIQTDLLKLAVTQSITGPLANLLGLQPSGASAGGGLGGLFGGSTTNSSVAPTSSGSGIFGGIGSFLFGGGGATSGLGGLLGFANEGSFQVGGTGGTDSQLVAFRASPDERVSIEKPGSRQSVMQTTRVEMHIHGVTDADSFRRAEDQIATRTGQKVNRALARNG